MAKRETISVELDRDEAFMLIAIINMQANGAEDALAALEKTNPTAQTSDMVAEHMKQLRNTAYRNHKIIVNVSTLIHMKEWCKDPQCRHNQNIKAFVKKYAKELSEDAVNNLDTYADKK